MTRTLLLFALFLHVRSLPSGEEHRIDLAARQIDGIPFAGTLSEIQSHLGQNSIQVIPQDIVSDQGDRVIDTLWVVTISGHAFTRFSNAVSVTITDSVFRTNEGVGIGSTVQEFVDYYGIPHFQEENIGYTLTFTTFNLHLSVYISPDCSCEHDFMTLDKTCPVATLFIVVPA